MPAGREDDKGRSRKVEAMHARRVADELLWQIEIVRSIDPPLWDVQLAG